MLTGALPVRSYADLVSTAHTVGRDSATLLHFVHTLAPNMVAETMSLILRERPFGTQDRLQRVSAVTILLRAVPDAGAYAAQRTGRTPLHWAAYSGYSIIAERMLAHGAEINGTDVYGYTPLDYAHAGGQRASIEPPETMAEWLTTRGAVRSGRPFSIEL
jgi:ankyrin repeat protein